MTYFCSSKNRRALVLQHPTLNGIDYLEVCTTNDPDCGCGKRLLLTLLKDARTVKLTPDEVRITGGSVNAQVSVTGIESATASAPRVITLNVSAPGDFSTYTLTILATATALDPPDGFDPQLSTVDFSFKAGCATIGDCLPDNCCAPPVRVKPDINYLAKDYEGFRQVMLDRLAVLVPGWTETHVPDMGIALVEALAYAADHLSYQQDAAATEAYIGTARSRISMRRHVRLVDYKPDEGSNARTWIYLEANGDLIAVPKGSLLFPRIPGLANTAQPGSKTEEQLLAASSVVFATMQDSVLYQEQNGMNFYTWSDANCCLAPGSTQATLSTNLNSLEPGTVLVFEEAVGPVTGKVEDADTTKRWAVRLTKVQKRDYLDRILIDPLTGDVITNIWWGSEDALPFPLCLSSTSDQGKPIFDVSVARGNIIPADHGVWQDWQDIGTVPQPPTPPVTTASCTCGTQAQSWTRPPRFYPQLAFAPLTFARPLDTSASAADFLSSTSAARPKLCVRDDQFLSWDILDDLLSSTGAQRVCVVEVERDASAFLRFGDGQYGMAPEPGTGFQARYRVGNGSTGNVGRDSLRHIVTASAAGIKDVRNPIAASGGTDPETLEHIRQRAPWAFRTQLRAVTEDDYGVAARLDPQIRNARGTFRWTGAWYTAFTSLDAVAADIPSPTLVASTKNRLNLLRMAGTDLDVEGAIVVGLRIEFTVCVSAAHFQSDVRDALMRVFITGDSCSGARGLLNPDSFSFGQTLYTSPLVAAAQAVDGVSSATVTAFQRVNDPSSDGTAQGFLIMGRLEVARCDNDPNRLDLGTFLLHMDGGK